MELLQGKTFVVMGVANQEVLHGELLALCIMQVQN